ncbi:Uncharacterised protein [Mycobacterium tuberculosis]|nr:Uncharacterised protein [Mycobacterium tuberculosis]
MIARPMSRPAVISTVTSATTNASRRPDHRGRLNVSACGGTRLTISLRWLMAEARPAAVLGRVSWSSSPETAPARIGWVWP